jgi:hypothetical protein
MDITGEFHQINICINQYRLVTPLEKMTPPALTPIGPLGGCYEMKGFAGSGKARRLPLESPSERVAHQTISMNPMAKTLDALLHQKAEASAVSIIEENRLPPFPLRIAW